MIDEALSIYHQMFENEAEEKFYLDRKNSYFKNHVKGRIDKDDSVLFYILIDKLDVLNGYKDDLLELYGDKISIQIYEYSFFKGYYFMKIYTSKASKLIALEEFLSKHNYDQVISFGSKEYDLEIMERSDYSVCLSNAETVVKQAADLVLDSDNQEAIIRYIKKRYYH